MAGLRPHCCHAAVTVNQGGGVGWLCHPSGMTPCSVQKCTSAANEAVEPLLVAGPLCDDHRARLLAGEDYELQGSEESATGMSQPTVLIGESLLALNQYVLLEGPQRLNTGDSRHGHVVPLRVQRRGEGDERGLNLVIPPEMLTAVADFFQRFSKSQGS